MHDADLSRDEDYKLELSSTRKCEIPSLWSVLSIIITTDSTAITTTTIVLSSETAICTVTTAAIK